MTVAKWYRAGLSSSAVNIKGSVVYLIKVFASVSQERAQLDISQQGGFFLRENPRFEAVVRRGTSGVVLRFGIVDGDQTESFEGG